MVAIDLPLEGARRLDTRRFLRLVLAGVLFWMSTSLFFTGLAVIDQAGRGFDPSPPYGLAGFLYGYASWILLAPAIYLFARHASPRHGMSLALHAGGAFAGTYAVVIAYCVLTQYAFHGHGPLEAVTQYSVFEWLWDGFLFGLVFLAGLRSHSPDTETAPVPVRRDERIAVRSPDRVDYVDIADVRAVSAQGNYAALMLPNGILLHRATLSSLALQMERAGFVRIHRSHIVHPDQIIAARARGDRIRDVTLKDGTRLPVSATFAPALAARLHGPARD